MEKNLDNNAKYKYDKQYLVLCRIINKLEIIKLGLVFLLLIWKTALILDKYELIDLNAIPNSIFPFIILPSLAIIVFHVLLYWIKECIRKDRTKFLKKQLVTNNPPANKK